MRVAQEQQAQAVQPVAVLLHQPRQRFLPVPGEFNVLWATDKNEVWFASTQNKMIDLFMEEFLKTFELHLEQLTPYNLAAAMLDEESLIRLDQLEATQFALLT